MKIEIELDMGFGVVFRGKAFSVVLVLGYSWSVGMREGNNERESL